MTGFQLTTTKAGRAALVNAEHNGTSPLTITAIGLTAAVFTPNEDLVDLPGEFKRIATISGETVAPDTIHVTIRDDSDDTYTMRGIGYWLSNGVLLGVYGQAEPILQKSTQSMMLLAADTVFTSINVAQLTFGNANFTNPPATAERQGVVELATGAETVTGTDATRAVTPAALTPALTRAIANHKNEADPHQQYLISERADKRYFHTLEAFTNSDTDCDTLLHTGVRDVSVTNDRGILTGTHLPMGADGYGTLTTVNGSQFIHQQYCEGGVAQRSWERTGYVGATPPFEGRPWKLVWNSGNFDPASKQNTLSYIPVQQGTGIGQISNVVKIGWSNGSGVKVTVDSTDMGSVVFAAQAMKLNWSGFGGQPTWLLGGNSADAVNVYNPSNFSVAYANSAGRAAAADSSQRVSNNADLMQFQWSDSGGQTTYVWGSDGPAGARLSNTSNLSVGSARNATLWGGFPLRYAENPGVMPYYFLGIEAGSSVFSLYNRASMAVASAVNATYATQLAGQGLQDGGIGSYWLVKNHTSPERAGGWELRGSAYDYGSGGDGGVGTRTALWQRVW